MALASTITYETPDKIEVQSDHVEEPRYRWKRVEDELGEVTFEKEAAGSFSMTKKTTTRTWFSCTYAACTTFETNYTGDGSINYIRPIQAIPAYELTLVEVALSFD